MAGYAIAKEPAEGELCPLLRIGTTSDFSLVPLNDGEVIVAADFRAYAAYARPGTWQSMSPFRWYCGRSWHYDDESLHTHVYYLTKNNGVLEFVITEPPLISQTYVRGTVSASLTIS